MPLSLLEQLAANGLLSNEEEGGHSLRRSVVLVGVTGDGKSSTGNTMSGGQNFAASDSFKSATQTCEHADYMYEGVPYRLIDTIGLQDTGLSADQVMDRFNGFADHTPGGIGAFLFVTRWGRWKPEHEAALDAFVRNAGEAALRYTILVFTHCPAAAAANEVALVPSSKIEAEIQRQVECALEKQLADAPRLLQGWLKRVHSVVAIDNCGSSFSARDRATLHRAVETLRGDLQESLGDANVLYSNSALAAARERHDAKDEAERQAFAAAVADWRKGGDAPVEIVREPGVVTRLPAGGSEEFSVCSLVACVGLCGTASVFAWLAFAGRRRR